MADILLELPALDQLLCADEQDEGAVGRAEHTVDLVDADVAVFCRFSGGQRHFEVDRHLQFLDHTVTTCVTFRTVDLET